MLAAVYSHTSRKSCGPGSGHLTHAAHFKRTGNTCSSVTQPPGQARSQQLCRRGLGLWLPVSSHSPLPQRCLGCHLDSSLQDYSSRLPSPQGPECFCQKHKPGPITSLLPILQWLPITLRNKFRSLIQKTLLIIPGMLCPLLLDLSFPRGPESCVVATNRALFQKAPSACADLSFPLSRTPFPRTTCSATPLHPSKPS